MKIMFWIGIILIVTSAILLIGKFMGDSSPMILGILGIVFIGASQYRPMKQKKK